MASVLPDLLSHSVVIVIVGVAKFGSAFQSPDGPPQRPGSVPCHLPLRVHCRVRFQSPEGPHGVDCRRGEGTGEVIHSLGAGT